MNSIPGSAYYRNQARLDRLVSSVLDLRAEQHDLSELEQIVFSDPRLLQRYFCHIHLSAAFERAGLSQAQCASTVLAVPPLPVELWTGTNSTVDKPEVDKRQSEWSSGRGFLRRLTRRRNLTTSELRGEWTVGVLVLAAVVLAFIGLATAVIYPEWLKSNNSQLATSTTNPPSFASSHEAAKISFANDVVWSAGTFAPAIGANLQVGDQLAIQSGTVQILGSHGAVVTLQGPVRYHVRGPNSGELQLGRLLAQVPAIAKGFTVDTPFARVVDLGTEFGIEVADSGSAEIHVIQGRVDATTVTIDAETGQRRPTAATLSLRAGETVQSKSEGIDRVVGSIEKFRQLRSVATHAHQQRPAILPNQLAGLRLWLRAESGVAIDEHGHVLRWDDQSGNAWHSTQDHFEFRPRLVPSGSGSFSPAVSFDGMDDFMLCNAGLEFDLAKDLTIVVVVARLPRFKSNTGLFSLRSEARADWNSFDGLAIRAYLERQQPSMGAVQGANKSLLAEGGNELRLGSNVRPHGPWIVVLTKIGEVATLRVNGNTVAVDDFDFRLQPSRQPTHNVAGYLLGARSDDLRGRPGQTRFTACDVAEVVVYEVGHTGQNAAKLDAYFHKKYLSPPGQTK